MNVLELDFGDLLQDDAARVLLRPSKKLGSDQANGYHLDAESNAWLQAFQEVCVQGVAGWAAAWPAGPLLWGNGVCRWAAVLCCWLLIVLLVAPLASLGAAFRG